MHKVEQQGYKPCASHMKLTNRYSTERAEKACEKALNYTPSPSLKNVSIILKNGQDKVNIQTTLPRTGITHRITRAAAYFKGSEL